MKPLKQILALSVAALAFGGTLYAQDAQSGGTEVKTVYQGFDAQGRIVKVTVTRPEGAPAVIVTTPSSPTLHWTAQIGSGTAASIPH
jgi:hypothetical protein